MISRALVDLQVAEERRTCSPSRSAAYSPGPILQAAYNRSSRTFGASPGSQIGDLRILQVAFEDERDLVGALRGTGRLAWECV